jgi:hypothetical protein
MMGTKKRAFAALPDDLSLEELVPKDNFYRRLEQFSKRMVPWLRRAGS